MSVEYANLVAAAKTAKRILLDAGFSESHADEVHERMVFLACSYLPPASGKLTLKFDDAKVNT